MGASYKPFLRETFEEIGIKVTLNEITKNEKRYYVRHNDIDFMFYIYSIKLDKEPKVILRSI